MFPKTAVSAPEGPSEAQSTTHQPLRRRRGGEDRESNTDERERGRRKASLVKIKEGKKGRSSLQGRGPECPHLHINSGKEKAIFPEGGKKGKSNLVKERGSSRGRINDRD